MKIRVLGSSGSESPGHNPPAFLVDDFILLDAGTVSLSLTREEECKITHIFLTHAHLDHVKAIPFLVDNIVTSGQPCRLTILSGEEVIADLKDNIFNDRIWPDFTLLPNPLEPVMRFENLSLQGPYEVDGYRIFAARVDHAVPSYGYIVEDPSGKALIYTGDTGPTERIWDIARDFRISALIIEVSFPDELLDLAVASGHMTPCLLEQELRKMKNLPERVYVTHLKPFYKNRIELQLARLVGVSTEILQDGMVIAL